MIGRRALLLGGVGGLLTCVVVRAQPAPPQAPPRPGPQGGVGASGGANQPQAGPAGAETGSRVPRGNPGATGQIAAPRREVDPPRLNALVISQSYAASPQLALANTARDAALIARTFRDLRFDRVTAIDRGSVQELLAQIQTYLDTLDRNTIAIVYAAGHGAEIGGENLLLLDDGTGFLSLQALLEVLQARAGVTVLFLDACRNNPLAGRIVPGASLTRAVTRQSSRVALQTLSLGEVQTRGSAGSPSLRPFSLQGHGVRIVFSTDPANFALDGARPNSRNSPFAAALARRLRTQLSLDDMISLATGDVIRATRGVQSPWSQGSIDRPIFLSGPRRRAQGSLIEPMELAG